MNNLKHNDLYSLNTTQLPVLPAGVSDLLKALTDENITFLELARIVEEFPSIAARLLVFANSAWSSPVEPVDSIAKACSRLGTSIVKNICIALAVAAPFSTLRCPSFNMPRFWCRSLVVADISSILTLKSKISSEQEISRTAGLLHNLGLLWITDQMPEIIEQAFIDQKNMPDTEFGEHMINLIGFDYADAGSFLCRQWGLPNSLADTIANHRNSKVFIQFGNNSTIVGHAVAFAKAVKYENIDLIPDSAATSLGLDETEIDNIYTQSIKISAKNKELSEAFFR